MDQDYQRRFKEVEITTKFHTKLGGLEKSHQENSVQPMLSWKRIKNDDDDYDNDDDDNDDDMMMLKNKKIKGDVYKFYQNVIKPRY